jgi:small-conductance mechanosensitive channel
VGVAYGTDPEIVTSLLLDVALQNKRVIEFPPPQAFFIEFGDSSLDFRLLAWMEQEKRFEVESEIRIEINRKLKEAGIVIPFPQRDLHLKTTFEDVGKKLKE